jgi:hypothetical protein
MLAPAFPDFLLRNISDQPRVRLSLLRKAHEVAQRHQPRQEIRDTWAENEILRMLSLSLTRSLRQVSGDT